MCEQCGPETVAPYKCTVTSEENNTPTRLDLCWGCIKYLREDGSRVRILKKEE